MRPALQRYKCASPTCPGLPYRASNIPHPYDCGATERDAVLRGLLRLCYALEDAARATLEAELRDSAYAYAAARRSGVKAYKSRTLLALQRAAIAIDRFDTVRLNRASSPPHAPIDAWGAP